MIQFYKTIVAEVFFTNKIKEVIIPIIGTVALCMIACLFVPALREPMLFFANTTYELFKIFHLEDTIHSVVLYIIISIVVTLAGVTITRQTENKIWIAVSILLDIVGLISLFIFT